jgi:hypothetical protein
MCAEVRDRHGTPSAANGCSNDRDANTSPRNRREATGKLDYATSDKTRLNGSYTFSGRLASGAVTSVTAPLPGLAQRGKV